MNQVIIKTITLVFLLVCFFKTTAFGNPASNPYSQEITKLKETIETEANNIKALNKLGEIYFNLKMYKQAEKQFESVLEVDPYYPLAPLTMGNIFTDREVYKNAIKDYKDAINFTDEQAKAYNFLGSIYSQKKDYVAAEESFLKAIKVNPTYIQAHNNLGILYEASGKKSKAMTQFEKALALDPGNQLIQHNRDQLRTSNKTANLRLQQEANPDQVKRIGGKETGKLKTESFNPGEKVLSNKAMESNIKNPPFNSQSVNSFFKNKSDTPELSESPKISSVKPGSAGQKNSKSYSTKNPEVSSNLDRIVEENNNLNNNAVVKINLKHDSAHKKIIGPQLQNNNALSENITDGVKQKKDDINTTSSRSFGQTENSKIKKNDAQGKIYDQKMVDWIFNADK